MSDKDQQLLQLILELYILSFIIMFYNQSITMSNLAEKRHSDFPLLKVIKVETEIDSTFKNQNHSKKTKSQESDSDSDNFNTPGFSELSAYSEPQFIRNDSIESPVYKKGREHLKDLYRFLNIGGQKMSGYPVTPKASKGHSQIIQAFSENLIVNLANPYNEGCYFTFNSNIIERKVIDFFADLYNVKDYWGYISSGSTEAILQGCMVGKRYLKKTYGKTPLFLLSKPSHYSFKKAARILDLDTHYMDTNERDQINIEKFEEFVKAHDKSIPLFVNINVGTTMKCAIDDHREIVRVLKTYGANYYIHADMAMYGPIFRFFHNFDEIFSTEVSSWNISGQKFFATPYCCAVFMGKKKFIEVAFDVETKEEVSYINCADLTISGSRNGILPVLLYESIRHGIEEIKRQAEHCLKMTDLLKSEMTKIKFPFKTNPHTNTVWFKTPSEDICKKFTLAIDGSTSHILCMTHMTPEIVADIIEQLRSEVPEF